MKNNFIVIMAGGFGERFWPRSSEKTPKQFLDLNNSGETLIKQTYNRFIKLCSKKNIYISAHKSHLNLITKSIKGINKKNIILEPEKKNTSPSILLSTLIIKKNNPEANILFSPADHHIKNEDTFIKEINKCFDFISQNTGILTIGIKPTSPATGYGYIKTSKKHNYNFYKIDQFIEKPNLSKAKKFIKNKNYYWNSGIFISKAKSILKEFEKNGKKNYKILSTIKNINEKNIKKKYNLLNNISFDYEILEKCKSIYMCKCNLIWSDLGSWTSVSEFMKKDKNNNRVNNKKIKIFDSKNNIINIDENYYLIAEGLSDYIVIQHKNKILICKKKSEQKIKNFLKD